MTVRVNKSSFSIREKLSELERPIGLKGSELMRAQTVQDARDLVGAGRKNLIINGDMKISQRGTQFTSVSTTGYYTADRFSFYLSSLGTWTIDKSTDSPDGFSNSFKVTCTSADASPASFDYATINYRLESQNLQHIGYGSVNAKPLTLSFYVKSNKAGNASFEILQTNNSNKLYSARYTINAANTWEKKVITIQPDYSGVINNDAEMGFELNWWMNSGTGFSGGSFGGWKNFTNASRNVSNLGVGGATSDYFAITGVQLEVGKNDTEFEYRSYAEELALCQRYFVILPMGDAETVSSGPSISANRYRFLIPTPVTMRIRPTLSYSGNLVFRTGGADYSISNMQPLTQTPVGVIVGGNAGTVGNALSGSLYAAGAASITLSAEL